MSERKGDPAKAGATHPDTTESTTADMTGRRVPRRIPKETRDMVDAADTEAVPLPTTPEIEIETGGPTTLGAGGANTDPLAPPPTTAADRADANRTAQVDAAKDPTTVIIDEADEFTEADAETLVGDTAERLLGHADDFDEQFDEKLAQQEEGKLPDGAPVPDPRDLATPGNGGDPTADPNETMFDTAEAAILAGVDPNIAALVDWEAGETAGDSVRRGMAPTPEQVAAGIAADIQDADDPFSPMTITEANQTILELTGERVTISDITSRIIRVDYFAVPNTTTILCAITLDNGQTAVGKSSCIDPENYVIPLGQKLAFDEAMERAMEMLDFLAAETRFIDGKPYSPEINRAPPPLPEPPVFQVSEVAEICHEANRAICGLLEEDQPPWAEAAEWQKSSALDGVIHTLKNPGAKPSDSHENWMRLKTLEGWTYGEKKDSGAKKHPCMVPYEKLPREQQAKDHLFQAIVNALRSFVT